MLLPKEKLIAVIPLTTAIHHEKIILRFQAQHRVMPDAAMVVDALFAIGHKGANQRRLWLITRRRHHNQKTITQQRINAWLPNGWRSSMPMLSGHSSVWARK